MNNISIGFATIVYGPASVQPATTFDDKKKNVNCWHLPGGGTTTSRDRAEKAASDINALMVRNGAKGIWKN